MQNQFVATFLNLRQQRDDAIREARPDYVDQQTDRWQLLLLLCYYCAHLSNPSVQQPAVVNPIRMAKGDCHEEVQNSSVHPLTGILGIIVVVGKHSRRQSNPILHSLR